MTASSTIKTRFATCLPRFQQKRIARAIKHSRTLNLLPYTGFLKGHHKRSLKNIYDDIEATTLRRVDLETGAVKIVQPETEWNETKPLREEDLEKLNRYDESIDVSTYNITNLDHVSLEQDSMVKATRYANYLKKKNLQESGIDVENIMESIKNSHMENLNASFETISTEETLEEDKAAFEALRVLFANLGFNEIS